MNNEEIYYLLGALGYIAHTAGKIGQRSGTVTEWLKGNLGYLVISAVAVAGSLLISAGDGVDLGTTAMRTLAFTIAATSAETVRMGYKVPAETKIRKAHTNA